MTTSPQTSPTSASASRDPNININNINSNSNNDNNNKDNPRRFSLPSVVQALKCFERLQQDTATVPHVPKEINDALLKSVDDLKMLQHMLIQQREREQEDKSRGGGGSGSGGGEDLGRGQEQINEDSLDAANSAMPAL